MDQMPFAWAERKHPDEPSEIALEPERAEALVVLMARALIAVVRAAEEDADER